MSRAQVVLTGRIRSDGNLELDRRPGLPEGPVRVTLDSVEPLPAREDTLEVLNRIVAARKARNAPTRTAAEIDAAVDEFRADFEREFQETENLQIEIRKRREQA